MNIISKPRQAVRSTCLHCRARSYAPCGGNRDELGLDRLESARSPFRRIAAGSSLFTPGETQISTYTVLTGWIAVTDTLGDGRMMILYFALPGDVVPLELQGRDSSLGAIAVGDATICAFSQAQHEQLLAEDALYAARYRATVARHLHFAYDHIADIALSSGLARVAKLFWEVAVRSLRRRPTAADRIRAPLSQIQVGLATGLTPVHVSRTVSKLRQAGLLTFERQMISIPDPAALERIIDMSAKTTAQWI